MNITADYINTKLPECEKFKTLEEKALTAESDLIKDLQEQSISITRLTPATSSGSIAWYKVPVCHSIDEDWSNETVNGQSMRIVHQVKPSYFTTYLLCST